LKACKVSTGPTAVLNSTVKEGGGTGFLAHICAKHAITRKYNWNHPCLTY